MSSNRSSKSFINDIKTVVFDIVGTLLDSTGTVIRETQEMLGKQGIDERTSKEMAEKWIEGQSSVQQAIIEGTQPWVIEDDIRRYQLSSILENEEIRLDHDDFEYLANVGRRFAPWPEASRQLNDLSSLITTIGLTNSGFIQIIEACTHGKLRWHALFSSQFARTYKPHPAAYKLAIDGLEIHPSKALYISTHPWDLRAAASHGFRTAYLPREYAQGPGPNDKFDLNLESLDDLINLLQRCIV
ncbi:HAD-IA family hydrolase [Terribacillus sp. 179-K 1B1 HS]|uniref:HAD-IA family hydrolase n=1 Tax=Terribacillus sp. 179-K 1B1 HS TaxID=3142388 RepID=UPI0039A11D75